MKYDIITVGSAVVDAFVESEFKEKNGEMLVPIGRKILVKHLGFATGGGGTNTAVAFSKFGLKTGFIGKLGRDGNAEIILNELRENSVNFLGTQGRDATGYSVILDSKKKDRTVLLYRGANENLSFDEIDFEKLKAKWFYFSSALGKSLETQIKLAKLARSNGIKIAYNVDSYVILNEREKVNEILKNVEVLIVNENEANDLCYGKWNFLKLFKLGPKIVCVTKGENGSEVCDGKFIYFVKPNKVKVVERTGAGDAFASGFVAGLMKFGDAERAVRVGTLNAESVIQKKGAKNGLLNFGEVAKKINSVNVVVVKTT